MLNFTDLLDSQQSLNVQQQTIKTNRTINATGNIA